MVDGYGIPLDLVHAPANRHAPDITIHLHAGYDSQKARNEGDHHRP